MKKNLLSVLILVLMIVNIALSAVMMANVIGTNNKTAELMDSIGAAMNLELYTPGEGPEVSLADTDTYVLPDGMMIPLAFSTNADGTKSTKQIYLMFDISLLMDKTHADYTADSGTTVSSYEPMIRDAIERVVSNYTEEECRASFTGDIRQEMLTAIQNLFQSKFIYGITLSNIKYGGS